MEELSTDCEKIQRTRVESGSSNETTESFIDDGIEGHVEECLHQKGPWRGVGIYHLNINDNQFPTKYNGMDYEAQRYKKAYNSIKTKRNWKLLAFILSIFIIIMIFAFFWEFNQIRDIKLQLELLDVNAPTALKSIQHPITPPNVFTAISLTGNGQLERGRKGIPILNWHLHFQHGNIAFVEGKKIHIKRSGLYNLYAQMFFYQNALISKRNFSANPVMDFGITKVRTNERVIAATVSLNACKVACTRHISSIVRLSDGDILAVDTATPGVYFKMIREKALFGTYMISAD